MLMARFAKHVLVLLAVMSVGAAQVSEKHCNFLINTGDATAYDIEALGEEVRRRVRARTGVALQWEIKRIGDFKAGHEVHEFLGQLL